MHINKLGLVLITMMVLLVTGCGGLIGLEQEKYPQMTPIIIDGKYSAIQLDLPYELVDLPKPDLGEFEACVTGNINKYGEGRNKITVTCISLDPDLIDDDFDPDLNEYIHGLIQGEQNKKEQILKLIDIRDTYIDSKPAKNFLVQSTEKRFSKEYVRVINGYVFLNGSDLWMIETYDLLRDNISQSVSEQIVNSIRIR